MALPLPVGGATFAVAPFGRRVAALCVDAAILAVVLWALAIAVRGALGLPAFTVAPWIDPAVVEIDRQPVTVEDERLYDKSGHRRVEFHVETRRYEDGTVRVYSMGEGVITHNDGRVEPVRSELLVARNFRGLVQLIAAQAVLFVLPFAYYAAFEASRWQATPGKILLGLKVVDLDGNRLSAPRALGRQFLKICEIVSTGFGYALGWLNGSGQAFHDILAGTRVVPARTK
jgi:uncharacterized RDD family membrane protein YckC